jgi:hypothetical protein
MSQGSLYDGIHIRAPILKIQEYTNQCVNICQYTVFTIQPLLELRNVSTVTCWSSSGCVHQYLYKT